MTRSGVYWIYVVIAVSAISVVIGFLGLNLGSIEKSRVGGLLIRWRWPIAILAGTVLISLGTYREVVRPMLNRASLLKEFEGTQGIDAYRNPLEVRLYKVYRENPYNYPPSPYGNEEEAAKRLQLEKEAWDNVSDHYLGFKFDKTTELLDPDCLKSSLDELYVYSSRSFDTLNVDYLIRFVGETSVLDIWLGDRDEINIFTNKLMFDVHDALTFSRPYRDLMEQSVGRGLKYHALGEHVLELWVNGLERLEE